MTFPKIMYIREEKDGGEKYFLVEKQIEDCDIQFDEFKKIATYELKEVKKVKLSKNLIIEKANN